jgi:hypothetical protein
MEYNLTEIKNLNAHFYKSLLKFILQEWGLKSGPPACKADPLPLQPQLEPQCAIVIFQIGPFFFLPRSASDCNPLTYVSHVANIMHVHDYT